MIINLNGCNIDTNKIDSILEHEATTVYSIDEDDAIYYDRESAMEAAESLKGEWNGDVIVSEYSVNVGYSETEGYYLIDETAAPLEFTGEYWEIPTTYRDLMDADAMSSMIEDWLADEGEEMADLELDGDPFYDEDLRCWRQYAHDAKATYSLDATPDGEIEINYLGAR